MAHDHKADMRAAFIGLILGAIAILIVVYSIVLLTNAKFASHSPAPGAPAAPAAQHD